MFKLLCIVSCAVSLFSVLIHCILGLALNLESNHLTQRDILLLNVIIVAFFTACAGGIAALIGAVGLIAMRRHKTEVASLCLASAGIAGPLYLLMVYGSYILLDL